MKIDNNMGDVIIDENVSDRDFFMIICCKFIVMIW